MSGVLLRLATRGSPLARWQAERVVALLAVASPGTSCELVVVDTRADRRLELPIAAFAGEGAFAAEVELAVLDGRADVAVHSAKDLPSSQPLPGLVLAAVPERGDPRDALVGGRLADLPTGALIATGSARRRAQLAWVRPDLGFIGLRGNIATRLSKVPPGGAVVVAAAALARLGLDAEAAELLPTGVLLPQAGQGAIALRCREGDERVASVLAPIDDRRAHLALRAERAVLAALGSGCEAPVGAFATVDADRDGPAAPGIAAPGPAAAGAPGQISLEAMIAAPDGHGLVRCRRAGDEPEQLGAALAVELLGPAGGRALLGELV